MAAPTELQQVSPLMARSSACRSSGHGEQEDHGSPDHAVAVARAYIGERAEQRHEFFYYFNYSGCFCLLGVLSLVIYSILDRISVILDRISVILQHFTCSSDAGSSLSS